MESKKTANSHPSYNLENTAFLLLTGNPAGFHHLMLAECALRQMPELKKIVFIISNGKHPDPTKTTLIPAKHLRLELLQSLLREYHNPKQSYLAQLVNKTEDPLRLNDAEIEISTKEFDQDLAFRVSDHLRVIRQHSQFNTNSHTVKVIVGADLLYRINNPQIFSDTDLAELQSSGAFLALPREHYDIDFELQQIQKHRQTTLHYDKLDPTLLPDPLRIFLDLSSTQLRRTIQAGHSLHCYLPKHTANLLYSYNLYREETKEALMNEWQLHCWYQEQVLEKALQHLLLNLDDRAGQKLPHTIAILETSTGGRLASTFASLSGASRHLKASLVPYDNEAKDRLLEQSSPKKPVVSKAMAIALAEAFQKQTNAAIVIAETGMAGPPEGYRRSTKNGQCFLAMVSAQGIHHTFIQCNPFLSKKEHQLQFTIEATQWITKVLETVESSSFNEQS